MNNNECAISCVGAWPGGVGAGEGAGAGGDDGVAGSSRAATHVDKNTFFVI